MYHYFMSVFTEAVEKKISNSHGRMVRLRKFTKGEARETTKHCIQKPSKKARARAKILLK